MTTDKIRKYVLPNLPYVFVFWFCLKLGTAYRIAEGVNFGEKLIGTFKTLTPAMRTIAPGFNGFDWLIGIIGTVIVWLIIYYKIKNAKQFRKDIEYGSARWGVCF